MTLRHEARQHLQYNTLGLHRSGRYKGLQLFPFSASFPIIHLHTCKFYPIPPGQVLPRGDLICSAGPFAGGLKEAFDFVGKGYFAFSSFLGPLIKYTLGAASQPGKELYGIEVTNNGLVIFGGGELLKNKAGVIVGAIGVSGGSVAEDTNVAKAGVAAFK